MKLTKRQRCLLELMDAGHACVEDRDAVWIDLERTNIATLLFFLRNCLVKGPNDSGGTKRYEITEWGVRALVEPDFDPRVELRWIKQRVAGAGGDDG